jgi:hypothetical protein
VSDPGVLWNDASPYSLDAVTAREEDWARAEHAADSLPGQLVEDARRTVARIDGGLRVLAVSEDGCIDSAHSIPHLAALADAVAGLELRLVDSSAGRALSEAHPSPDGRAATPTVLLLDEAGELRGCWIERPAPVQSWYLANPDGLGRTELYSAKTAWYEADGGVHLIAEFNGILRAAAAGTPVCGVPLDAEPALPEPGRPPASPR